MKPALRKAGLAAIALALGGFLVAASGIIPIKASSGHWTITEWFLRFSMRRSIATHSLGVAAPTLDDPALVLKGAGHFETGCRSCHGSPGTRQPRIAEWMTPTPPLLPDRIRESNPEKLFHVVKHGLKFTGMPAWPAQERDDEVWAVVAFLLKLPELDEEAYQRLVHGEPRPSAPHPGAVAPELPPAVEQSCARCHGHDGLGREYGVFPKLAGQRVEYLENALEAYAKGSRPSGIMEPVAAGLSEEAVRELSRYYAELPRAPVMDRTADDAAAIARGREIARRGIPAQRVPICADCHEPGGRHAKPAYPSLTGQFSDYLELQLRLFKEGVRGGSEYAHLMDPVVSRLKPEQMRDVALYFESLPAQADVGEGAAP